MSEALVFGPTFEALARALGSRLTNETKDRFGALGVDFNHVLLPAYPFETWVKAMDLGSQLVMPNATERERHAAMGRRMVDSYGETLVGRALLTAMRVIGPRRTLERMARNLRTANNYTETKLSAGSDGAYQLWCSRVASTAFYCGMLQRGVEVAGGKGVLVEALGQDAAGATFSVRWG
ncbi:MAG: DUF2378 family protein [Myxococcaceae bacterium]|nr:DUF2378 family protein [Myxococcaceae bacterium]